MCYNFHNQSFYYSVKFFPELNDFLESERTLVHVIRIFLTMNLIKILFNPAKNWFFFTFINCSFHEKCPNTELFLVRIFLYSDWIRIQFKYRRIRTRNNYVFGHFLPEITPYLDTFHEVFHYLDQNHGYSKIFGDP